MKKLLFMAMGACVVQIESKVVRSSRVLNDGDAYAYCAQHKSSFVAIVWPLVQGRDRDIEYLINAYRGAIKYKKQVVLNPEQAYYLLKTAHPHIPDMRAHVAWYFPTGTFAKPARVYVVTFKNKATAVACKYAIRKMIGLEYRSIHVNDTHKETMELADFFFKA
jgi:hypothetical protein